MNEELPLPEFAFSGWDYGSLPAVQRDGYTADQMREYAELVRADERDFVMNEPITKAHWQRFEKDIRADEREACAKLAESYLSENPHSWGGTTMAAAIRARGNT